MITDPYITIAGQTAAGDGVLITRYNDPNVEEYGEAIQLGSGTRNYDPDGMHDAIIRYLKIRMGKYDDEGGTRGSAIKLRPPIHDVIIDHVSASWGADKVFGAWFAAFHEQRNPFNRITYQRNIVAEALEHSTGQLIGGDLSSNSHLNISEVDFHHNLYISNPQRNPSVTTAGAQVINNVIYNYRWGANIMYSGIADFIANYYKPGPMTTSPWNKYAVRCYETNPQEASIYVKDNLHTVGLSDYTQDNWILCRDRYASLLPEEFRKWQPLPMANIPITIQNPHEAYDTVLANVGANARLDVMGNLISNSDKFDLRYLEEIVNNSGISSPPITEADVVGYPPDMTTIYCSQSPNSCYPDIDHDGMSDTWEEHWFSNLNQGGSANSSSDYDGDGYTDLEEFLNGTNPKGVEPLPSPSPNLEPSPTLPPATGPIYEAELADLYLAAVNNDHDNYSGTGFVNFDHVENASIIWNNINVPNSGNYDLVFHYALGVDELRPLQVEVNGNIVNPSLAFPQTANWSDWQQASLNTYLNQGINTVKVTTVNIDGPNIDYLQISRTQPTCFGQDNQINTDDVLVWLTNYLFSHASYDVIQDNKINSLEFSYLLNHWGESCQP